MVSVLLCQFELNDYNENYNITTPMSYFPKPSLIAHLQHARNTHVKFDLNRPRGV